MIEQGGYMYRPSELCENFLGSRRISPSDIEPNLALENFFEAANSGDLKKAAIVVVDNRELFDKPGLRLQIKKAFDMAISMVENELDEFFMSCGVFDADLTDYYEIKNRLISLRLGFVKRNPFEKE